MATPYLGSAQPRISWQAYPIEQLGPTNNIMAGCPMEQSGPTDNIVAGLSHSSWAQPKIS